MTTTTARAWIDAAAEYWRHECYGYGPDDDAADLCDFDPSGLWFHDEPRPTDDDTVEVECPIVIVEDDGEQD